MSVSEFYYACRNGDVTKVKTLLPTLSTTEIDRMEPNGSTALHAAAYSGHIDIVHLLLDKGASTSQKNKYDKIPEKEAKTPEIAQLFQDTKAKLTIDWAIRDLFTATSYHRRFYSFSQGPPTLSSVVDKLVHADELFNVEFEERQTAAMKQVRSLFLQAVECADAQYLIRAYTMESDFYRILNKKLQTHMKFTDEERENPPWFCAYARFLASDETSLRSYRWTGVTYRGIKTSIDGLALYHIGKILMNKSFLSTAKSREVPLMFAAHNKGKDERGVLFKYIVNDDRAALDIRNASMFSAEEEVLILPCMDFEITEINDSGEHVEITLLLR